jgi:hypothetical protein
LADDKKMAQDLKKEILGAMKEEEKQAKEKE